MSNTEITWVAAIAGLIITAIVCLTWTVNSADDKIARMVEAGADPLDAACAMTARTNHCVLANRD